MLDAPLTKLPYTLELGILPFWCFLQSLPHRILGILLPDDVSDVCLVLFLGIS